VNWDNEIISSSGSTEGELEAEDDLLNEENGMIKETPNEKRLRLAKEMIERVKATQGTNESDRESEDDDDGEDSSVTPKLDAVSRRIHEDLLRAEGRLQRQMSTKLDFERIEHQECARHHRLSITCVAISTAEDIALTASKDCSIIRWDVETGKRVHKFPGRPATKNIPAKMITGHFDEILTMAVSSDGRYLASGGRDKLIRLWDLRTNEELDAFKGHRAAISGL